MRSILSFGSSSLFGLLVLCLADGASADDGMRCGSRLVSKGDTLYEVRSVCGDPDATDRKVVTRTEVRRVQVPCFRDQSGTVKCEKAEAIQIDVVIDEWTYDFGTQRLVRLVTFENGQLLKVVAGGYGYKTAAN